MRTVFVAAANVTCRERVRASLSASGADVRTPAAEADLFEAMTHASYDLIVLEDAPQAGLDALALVRASRAQGVESVLVVVGVDVDAERIRLLLAAGASAFVSLPEALVDVMHLTTRSERSPTQSAG